MTIKNCITIIGLSLLLNFQIQAQGQWTTVTMVNEPDNRHECSFVFAGDKYYLMGGRGIKAVEYYDPVSTIWTAGNPTPFEIHHFQAVEYHGLIYIIGAMTGGFPSETPVGNVYIYDPVDDNWHQGVAIPVPRRRGSAGLVNYNGKLYLAAGIVNGHLSGWVEWLDEYDPKTNNWTILPDAPEQRDHYHAVAINDKLVLAGGRKSGFGGSTFDETVPQVDIYDFNTGVWSTLPASLNIPTERAGCAAVSIGDEVIIIGGESGTQSSAHNETEGFNVITNSWRTLDNLNTGRHGSQAFTDNDVAVICCGSGNQGGTPELDDLETFAFGTPGSPSGLALVSGTATGPASVDFGYAYGDTNSVYIHNTGGNQALLVDDYQLKSGVDYTLIQNITTPFAVPPGDSVEFKIVFNPSNSNYSSDSLIIDLLVPESGSFTSLLEGNRAPTLNAVANTEICTGDSVQLSINGSFDTYQWSNGETSESIYASTSGSYYAILSLDSTILHTDTVSITVSEPVVGFIVTNVSCDFGTDGAIDLNVSAGYPPYSFLWSTGDTIEDLDSLSSGTYIVVVTDSKNCTTSGSATVSEPISSTSPQASFSYVPNGLTVSFSNLSVNASSYLWDFGDGSPTSTDSMPDHTYASTGSYSVELEVANDCDVDDTTIVVQLVTTVATQPIASFNIFMDPLLKDIVLTLRNGKPIGGTLSILDMRGRMIASENVEPSNYEGQTIRYSVSALQDGFYFVTFRTKTEMHSSKFVVH